MTLVGGVAAWGARWRRTDGSKSTPSRHLSGFRRNAATVAGEGFGGRQTSFGDLYLPGGAKPVLIVCGPAYAAATGYASVLGARMISKHAYPHRFDVVIHSSRSTSKIGCSDVQTIPVDWPESLLSDPTATNPAEWVQIRRTLRQFLGLEQMSAEQPGLGTTR